MILVPLPRFLLEPASAHEDNKHVYIDPYSHDSPLREAENVVALDASSSWV